MADKYDLVVLGGGPGGYPAAIRARQLGMRVALVEAKALGGTCLNVGCIPTKALIRVARTFAEIRDAKRIGINLDNPALNPKKVDSYKTRIVRKLVAGTKLLLEENGADIIEGFGRMKDSNSLDVDGKIVEFKNLMIATGSKVRHYPPFPIDGKKIVSSDEAVDITDPPKRIGILGAGAIGMEFAYVFRNFGSEVTVFELLERPLPIEDPDAGRVVGEIFEKMGVAIHCGFKATSAEIEGDTVKFKGEMNGELSEHELDLLLVSIGREPANANCGFEEIGIEMDRGFVKVDAELKTNIPHIFAIGDCARPPLLAHKATLEGIYVAEILAGMERKTIDNWKIPSVTYCWPEVGSIGLNEETAAKYAEGEFVTKTFPLEGNSKSLIEGAQEGFIKAIADKKTDKLLGITIVGPNASDLMSGAVIAMDNELTTRDLAHTCFPHPTVGEIFGELGHSFMQGPLHLPPME